MIDDWVGIASVLSVGVAVIIFAFLAWKIKKLMNETKSDD
jgi:hypothetical protein